MTVFKAMVRSLFDDPNMASDGLYTPVGGSTVQVRVIESSLSEVDPLLTLGVRRSTMRFELLQAQVETRPEDGDILQIADDTYRIRSAEADLVSQTWALDVDNI